MSQKIPTTIITGFLGAGKTTLVQNLLANAKGRRIALIINEFGDIGVDRDILSGCGDEVCRDEDMIELANGCICCTVADDFIPAMTQLLNREDRLDHIIIETSGLALPQPLVKAFNWPEIKTEVTVDGVVAVVDADAFAHGRFAADEGAVDAQRQADESLDHESPLHELFEDQLRCADMVILSKSDLVADDKLTEIQAELTGEVRDGVRFIAAQNGKVDIDVLLGQASGAEDDMDARLSHHEADHGHDDHEHDDFDSFSVSLAEDDRAALLGRIESVIRDHDVLRLKGFAAVAGSPARLAIQAVGPRLESYFDRPWREGETRETRLVVIGQAPLDADAITQGLQNSGLQK